MAEPLLGLGVIGIRLYARILTAPATYPEELADHIVDEINCYLSRATDSEKQILFHIACEIHDALAHAYPRVNSPEVRQDIISMMSILLCRAKALSRHPGA
jgi:hypothetical protein